MAPLENPAGDMDQATSIDDVNQINGESDKKSISAYREEPSKLKNQPK